MGERTYPKAWPESLRERPTYDELTAALAAERVRGDREEQRKARLLVMVGALLAGTTEALAAGSQWVSVSYVRDCVSRALVDIGEAALATDPEGGSEDA